MSNVIIPNNVQTIKYAAFFECINLSSISIPESVISVEQNAFHSCSSLTSVIVHGKTYDEASALLSDVGLSDTCQIITWNDAS